MQMVAIKMYKFCFKNYRKRNYYFSIIIQVDLQGGHTYVI